jgi:FG-GAP-like repeat
MPGTHRHFVALPWTWIAPLALLPIAPVSAQEARAVLHAPLAVLPIDSAPFQRLADLDGDGDLDAIGSRIHENRSNTEIVVWRNDQGGFTPVLVTPFTPGGIGSPAPRSFAIATADLNADGLSDFVVAGGSGMVVFTAQPGLVFQQTTYPLPIFVNQHALATGDFDGNGVADFAVAFITSGSPGGELRVYPTGGAMVSTPISVTYEAPLRLEALPLDGAPGDEVLLSDRNAALARVYGLTGGVLSQQQALTTTLAYTGGTPWLWSGGDLDGDGDCDVVVFKPELGTNGIPRYQVFRRSGAATFTAEPTAIGGPAEYLADIDGDGDLDGVCCGGGGPVYQWPKLDFASTFEIAPNDGSGAFATAWAFPGAGSESMAGARDVDGDGDVDFVAGRCIYYGRGGTTRCRRPGAATRWSSGGRGCCTTSIATAIRIS